MEEDLEQLIADNRALGDENMRLKCELLNVRQERDGQMDGNDALNRENADIKARVAELEAAIAIHRKERLPHMTNTHDRALWSIINP